MSGRRNARKARNVLTFTPKGFSHSVDVPFPDRRLPVCTRCKKYFKTRECCRTRDGHTALPWSLSYVCMTLDPSCTDGKGKVFDGPLIARALPDQPYIMKGEIDPMTPICTMCKDKNYTRSYCRSKKKHPFLPWSTVYVILSRKSETQNEEPREEQSSPKKRKVKAETVSASPKPADDSEAKVEKEEEKPKGDSIESIAASRTFIAHISDNVNAVYWLDIDESAGPIASFADQQILNADPKLLYLQASQQLYLANNGVQQFRQQGAPFSQPNAPRSHEMYGAPYGMMQHPSQIPNAAALSAQIPGGGLPPQFQGAGMAHLGGDNNGFAGVQNGGALAMAHSMNQQITIPQNSQGASQARMNANRGNQLWMNRMQQMNPQQMWGMMNERDLNDPQYYNENLREAALMQQQGANPFMGMGNNISLQVDENGMYQQQGNSNVGEGSQQNTLNNRGLEERQF